jgi:hypothetical protein
MSHHFGMMSLMMLQRSHILNEKLVRNFFEAIHTCTETKLKILLERAVTEWDSGKCNNILTGEGCIRGPYGGRG